MKFGRCIRDRTRLIRKNNSERNRKNEVFLTGDGILMKFYVWKDIVSQSTYFKSRPDLLKLGGGGWGGLKSWKTLRMEGSG